MGPGRKTRLQNRASSLPSPGARGRWKRVRSSSRRAEEARSGRAPSFYPRPWSASTSCAPLQPESRSVVPGALALVLVLVAKSPALLSRPLPVTTNTFGKSMSNPSSSDLTSGARHRVKHREALNLSKEGDREEGEGGKGRQKSSYTELAGSRLIPQRLQPLTL